jgi:hypothetical protein
MDTEDIILVLKLLLFVGMFAVYAWVKTGSLA